MPEVEVHSALRTYGTGPLPRFGWITGLNLSLEAPELAEHVARNIAIGIDGHTPQVTSLMCVAAAGGRTLIYFDRPIIVPIRPPSMPYVIAIQDAEWAPIIPASTGVQA